MAGRIRPRGPCVCHLCHRQKQVTKASSFSSPLPRRNVREFETCFGATTERPAHPWAPHSQPWQPRGRASPEAPSRHQQSRSSDQAWTAAVLLGNGLSFPSRLPLRAAMGTASLWSRAFWLSPHRVFVMCEQQETRATRHGLQAVIPLPEPPCRSAGWQGLQVWVPVPGPRPQAPAPNRACTLPRHPGRCSCRGSEL